MLSTVNKTIKLKLTKIVKKNYLISKKKLSKKNGRSKKNFQTILQPLKSFQNGGQVTTKKKFRNRKQIYFFYFPLKKNYLILKKKISKKNGRPKKFSKQFYKNLTTPAMDKCCINMNKTVRVTYNKLLTRTLR